MTIAEFAKLEAPVPVVVHSLDMALYQVTLQIDGGEHLLAEDSGRPLRSRNLVSLLELLSRLPVASAVLRQRSAYDEMVGQPLRDGDNALELPLVLPEVEQASLH
ncbi:hypothetical protein E4634_13580 [Mangrovimicrobium sediminis]|uniref:Uncharacterized protein n=2 Tax=Mangrovimicrobium sediminis TaxID=2562682 RepID=A0A4Z0M025_9GAMM|nr:hypothetical protein E4634_13580 [Haliea sp. SAOS-164]